MSNTANLQLNDVTKFRLDEINKVKDYFNNEIKERKQTINKISKFIKASDYADKVFIVLSASFGSLSIASRATVVGIPGTAGASLTLVFTACTGVVKKLLSVTRKKKKKHNKIMVLATNGLNMIETLLSSALTDFDISHE